jgi:hypothetical protein
MSGAAKSPGRRWSACPAATPNIRETEAMNKLGLSPLERERKLLTRALATDNVGNEILIGLTHEETRWYLDHEGRLRWRAWENHNDDRSLRRNDYQQYQALHTRHYMTQLYIIFGEDEAARKPKRH